MPLESVYKLQGLALNCDRLFVVRNDKSKKGKWLKIPTYQFNTYGLHKTIIYFWHFCLKTFIGVGMVGMIESKGEERRARSGRDFHIYIVSTQRHSAVMISNHHHCILCVISYYIVFLSFTSNIVKIWYVYSHSIFFSKFQKFPKIFPFVFLCFLCIMYMENFKMSSFCFNFYLTP